MRWPWRRRRNGEAAEQAKTDAQDQLREANDRSPHVDRTVRNAGDVARGADRFARDIERSMRRGPA